MAKRKTYTRTIYRKARAGYRKRKGFLGGNMNNLLWGAIGGAISGFIPNNLPVVGRFAKPVILGAGGYILHKPQLITCAGYEAGKMLMSGGAGAIFNQTNNAYLMEG